MEHFEDYIESIRERLESRGYKIIRGVTLPGGLKCDLVAAKTYFSWKGFVFLSQYVFVSQAERPTPADSQRLFEAGLEYCRQGGDRPIRFRGVQAGGMIVPCLVSPSIDNTLVEFAKSIPRKHWALFEFPVFHDLTSGETHYCRKKGAWGRLFYTDFHRLVADCLVSKSDSPAYIPGTNLLPIR